MFLCIVLSSGIKPNWILASSKIFSTWCYFVRLKQFWKLGLSMISKTSVITELILLFYNSPACANYLQGICLNVNNFYGSIWIKLSLEMWVTPKFGFGLGAKPWPERSDSFIAAKVHLKYETPTERNWYISRFKDLAASIVLSNIKCEFKS